MLLNPRNWLQKPYGNRSFQRSSSLKKFDISWWKIWLPAKDVGRMPSSQAKFQLHPVLSNSWGMALRFEFVLLYSKSLLQLVHLLKFCYKMVLKNVVQLQKFHKNLLISCSKNIAPILYSKRAVAFAAWWKTSCQKPEIVGPNAEMGIVATRSLGPKKKTKSYQYLVELSRCHSLSVQKSEAPTSRLPSRLQARQFTPGHLQT